MPNGLPAEHSSPPWAGSPGQNGPEAHSQPLTRMSWEGRNTAGPVWLGVEVAGGGLTAVSLIYSPTHTPCTPKAPATLFHTPHSLFYLGASQFFFFICTRFLLA